jgi:hypothetical protein
MRLSARTGNRSKFGAECIGVSVESSTFFIEIRVQARSRDGNMAMNVRFLGAEPHVVVGMCSTRPRRRWRPFSLTRASDSDPKEGSVVRLRTTAPSASPAQLQGRGDGGRRSQLLGLGAVFLVPGGGRYGCVQESGSLDQGGIAGTISGHNTHQLLSITIISILFSK